MKKTSTYAAAVAACALAGSSMLAGPALASAPNSNGADEIIERCMEFVEEGLYYESIGECIRTFNKSEVEICQNNRAAGLDFDRNQGQCVKRQRNATRRQ